MECFNCGVEIVGEVSYEHNGNIYCKTCHDEFFKSKIQRLNGQKTGIASVSSAFPHNDSIVLLNGMSEKLSGSDDRDLFGEV